MRYKKLILGALTAATLVLTPALGANAATPSTSTNPLVQSAGFDYNDTTYSLVVTRATDSATVTRDGYRVGSSYNVRITQGSVEGAKVYSGKLGYTRAAYLHTKLIGLETANTGGLDVHRAYSLATFVKKVAGFSAAYDRTRLDSLIRAYRERTLRSDVTATGQAAQNYIATKGSLDGVQNDKTVTSKTNGYFGYSGDNVNVRLFVDPSDSSDKTYEVVGLEKPDLYQSVFDSSTGATRSGTISSVSNIN